jgi:hypothetical protein
MKKIRSSLALLLMSLGLAGQSLQYGGLQQLSLSFGESGTTAGLSVVNGVRFSRFFAGIGADARFNGSNRYYGPWAQYDAQNTSALFADARYYINKQKNFFTKVNGGVNVITSRMDETEFNHYSKHRGLYTAIGLGFKAKMGKELFYSFDVSYCTRQTRYDHHYMDFRGWQTEKLDRKQYMIVVNLGLEIF